MKNTGPSATLAKNTEIRLHAAELSKTSSGPYQQMLNFM